MTKTGIALALVNGEWTAPCGCRFHAFDGLHDFRLALTRTLARGANYAEVAGNLANVLNEETVNILGTMAPHWHPCATHGGSA